MAKKQKPTHEIRLGAIRATFWTNVSSSGERWYTVAINRIFKDSKEQWQETHSYKMHHLPELIEVVQKAYRWLEEHCIEPEGSKLIEALTSAELGSRDKTTRRSS